LQKWPSFEETQTQVPTFRRSVHLGCQNKVEFWQKKKKKNTTFLPDIWPLWMIASPLIWQNCKIKKKLKNKFKKKNHYVLTLPTQNPNGKEKKNGVKTHSRKPGELKETKSWRENPSGTPEENFSFEVFFWVCKVLHLKKKCK
jgi:hypothetical protein